MHFKQLRNLSFAIFLIMSSCSEPHQNAKQSAPVKSEKQHKKGFIQHAEMHLSLQIPEGMTATTTLDENAQLQYENRQLEHYFIGTFETRKSAEEALTILHFNNPKQSLGANYVDFTLDQMREGIQSNGKISRKSTLRNGNEFIALQMDGTVTGVNFPISYFITIATTPDRVYKFVSWTLKSQKQSFDCIQQQLIASIQFD